MPTSARPKTAKRRAPATKKAAEKAKKPPATTAKAARPARGAQAALGKAAKAPRPRGTPTGRKKRGYAAQPVSLPPSALAHLRRSHRNMARVIDRVGDFTLEAGHPEGPFVSLVRAIVFQQLATGAANTIFGRLRALFPAPGVPSPTSLLALPEAALRGCGLSSQKLSYVRDLASRVASGELDLDALPDLPDDEVIARLTTVRGIGRWSAQMFLIFYLGRIDVWPDGDLGIKNGLRLLHAYADLPTPAQMQAAGQKFSPYASVASWYLWRLLDVPAEERALLLV